MDDGSTTNFDILMKVAIYHILTSLKHHLKAKQTVASCMSKPYTQEFKVILKRKQFLKTHVYIYCILPRINTAFHNVKECLLKYPFRKLLALLKGNIGQNHNNM